MSRDLGELGDQVIAAVDLCGRAGARSFQIGYLYDDVPSEQAGWYAHAQYKGVRITADDCPSPGAAAEELARKLLTGAKCGCGRLVALSDVGAVAFERPVMADGTVFTTEQATAAGQCRWTRTGDRWNPPHSPRQITMPPGSR